MSKKLRFISISHKRASVVQREQYYFNEEEKHAIVKHLCKRFPDISGMLLLATCNRMEVYIESESTTSSLLQNEVMAFKRRKGMAQDAPLFYKNDNTKNTLRHLLRVSLGLESKVLGDTEIIHQIKKAYLYSMAYQLQGSLLERAMQTVFRSHKRSSNETNFRDGTTSLAYKSLKVVSDTYGKKIARTKKILFIGTGDIVVQLFKYNSKFDFNNIYISNRTEERAHSLAAIHQCNVFEWKNVQENDFQDFDVIISAVSNCPQLIKNIPLSLKKRVLVDLALPGNVDKSLGQMEHVNYYDLDTISVDLEENKGKRRAALEKVKEIIDIELAVYIQWLDQAALRLTLANRKRVISEKVRTYLESKAHNENTQTAKVLTNRIMKKMFSQSNSLKFSSKEIDSLIAEQAALQLIPSI